MNRMKWCSKNWWVVILLLTCLVATIAMFTPYTEGVSQWAKTLMDLLTPISVLLGLILGYPLIKKKLTEQYITRQFEIIANSNREVRNKVIKLLDMYKVKYMSNRLSLEYIRDALEQITELKYTAIDAAPDVYRYVNLIHRMLTKLEETYSKDKREENVLHKDYKEQLSTWLHYQLNEVFDYSRTIGFIPTGEILQRKRLNSRLSKFVTHNDLVEIKDVSSNIEYYHSEAMLVLYFGKTMEAFASDNYELYKATYLAVPSPSPFARLLLNDAVYFPPVLRTREKLLLDYGELHLIGYKRKKSFGNGIETTYYEIIYSNFSNIAFVKGGIKNIKDLGEFHDAYLDIPFPIDGLSDLSIFGETIRLRMPLDEVQRRFACVREKLKKTLKEEVKM